MSFYYPDRKFSERQCLIYITNENYNHKKVQLFLNTTIELVVCLLIRFHIHLTCLLCFYPVPAPDNFSG